MTTSTYSLNGIEVPEDDESALFDAHRRDIDELGDAGLFAAQLGFTVNLHEASTRAVGFQTPLQPGEQFRLDAKERFIVEASKKSVGKGIKVVDLLYNKFTKRYEILRQENGRFVREGNAGEGEDSLYHCMVHIMQPTLARAEVASRATFYKKELTAIKSKISDSEIRETLKKEVIPGSHVEAELQRISLDREKYVIRLKGLIRQLRDELDTREPPQIGRSKYAGTFQETRHLVETLEYDYDRRVKDFSHEQLVQEYKRIQRNRLRLLQQGYKNAYDWQEKDVYIQELIKGDEDFKAVALVAVLDDETLDVNERFRLTTSLVTNTDPEKLKKTYMQVRGTADLNTLETDMKAKFHEEGEATTSIRLLDGVTKYFTHGQGHKLQFPYLKSLLETGEQSPSAQLAMKLGLLYRGFQVTNLTPKQKDEIGELVEANPGELAALANVDEKGKMRDTDDEFLQAAFAKLKKDHTGVLGDMQARIERSESSTQITGVDVSTINEETISDVAAKSLVRMLYDAEKREIRTVGPSPTDTTEVRKKIVDWIKGCSEEELKKFIEAADSKKVTKKPNAYQIVWSLIDRHMERAMHRGKWKEYFRDMADAQVQHKPEELMPFYEVEAFLKYKKSRGAFLCYKEKKQTLAKVLNMLSASDGWDPKAKLKDLVEQHTDLKNNQNYEEYKDDPSLWLDDLLRGAGVDAEGREQVNLLLYAGATYNGDEATDSARNIDKYLSLKRKAHRKYLNARLHGLSTENILTTIGKVKTGSLEHWLIRKDKKLLKQIRGKFRDEYKAMYDRVIRMGGSPDVDLALERKKLSTTWSGISQTLDLSKKWQNLDIDSPTENSLPPEEKDPILPEPPSKDDLKAFKDKYKDEELKKKIWAGKYVLTYSLAKEQSLFNMSDRKELLKAVYAGQLEGYKGDELMKILDDDDVDPVIRESLTRTPSTSWTKHEKAAHAQLKKFLIDGDEINFGDFLNVAKGLLNNDYDVIDFAVNDLSPEKSAALWFSSSYTELKTMSETRLQKTLKLHGMNARNTGIPSAEAKQLEADIADLDKKISQHEFKLDSGLKSQLEGLTLDGKAAEFERKLKQKIGEKMLSKPESFEDLHIPPFELARKGTKFLAEADIKYLQYLRTGVGYHRFSVSGLESYAEGNNFLRNLWKTARAQPTGTAAEREEEEQKLLEAVKTSHDDLLSSLDKWKDKQDEYTKRVVNVVNQTLSMALYTAMAASGIGAVAFVALGPVKAALTTVVTKLVEKAISRKGEVLTREIVKEVMVSAASAVPGVLASVDYGDVPGLKKIINNTIGSSLVKGQITAVSKAIVGAVGNVFVASGTGSFEMNSKAFQDKIVGQLKEYYPTNPQIYKTVLTSLSLYASKQVSGMIKAGVTDMDEAAFKKLDPATQAELTAKFKPLQILYKNFYNTAMTNKGYELLSEGAAKLANLPFADDVEVDKNEIEQERNNLAIANSLVEVLAEKGLRVDSDFDYSDSEKLMEQIVDKMPGMKLTEDEIKELTTDVDSSFAEKQEQLTEDEKRLPESEKKKLLLEKAKEDLLKNKKAPWMDELKAMKHRFNRECNAVKLKAERKAEEESKQLEANVQEVKDGETLTETLKVNKNPVKGEEKASPSDESSYIVAQAIATRLYGKKSKKSRAAARKKVEKQWRLHREKKKEEAKEKSTANA